MISASALRLPVQQEIVRARAVSAGSVTNRQVQEGFDVVKDTALRDLTTLCQLALLEKEGKGRSIRYIPKRQPSKSPDNRPIWTNPRPPNEKALFRT
jgi:predicted HTH transcriptional regulator